MILEITPSPLFGEVKAIDSKSELHRDLICAALADKPCTLYLAGGHASHIANDVKTTIDCLTALGATIDVAESTIVVTPIKEVPPHPVLDCKESGSTLRFLMPVATALCDEVTFEGNARLSERPIGSLKNAMEAHGVEFSSAVLPFTTKGKLHGGNFEVTGDLSSQYVSGLLLTLPLFEEESSISLTTPLLSRGYVDITVTVLYKFGVTVLQMADDTYKTFPSKNTEKAFVSPGRIKVEGDWSNSAFFYVANFLGNEVTINNLNFMSLQRDKKIVDFLNLYQANSNEEQLFGAKSYEFDLSQVPDLLPALSVAAAFADGTTTINGAARLRLKESDRLMSVSALINSLGGKAEDTADGIVIYPQPLVGGTVESFGDHRIVMAATIAATRCTEPVIINEARAIDKSYPSFFEDIKALGGIINVI